MNNRIAMLRADKKFVKRLLVAGSIIVALVFTIVIGFAISWGIQNQDANILYAYDSSSDSYFVTGFKPGHKRDRKALIKNEHEEKIRLPVNDGGIGFPPKREIKSIVTEIASSAFSFSDSELREATIPNNIERIGTQAFSGNEKLQRISISKNRSKLVTIGGSAFANNAALTKFTIPKQVERIEYGAFSGSGIKEIFIPKSVTSLGSGVFEKCADLKFINIERDKDDIPDGWATDEFYPGREAWSYGIDENIIRYNQKG